MFENIFTVKNKEYLYEKKDKILTEIKFLENQPDNRTGLVCLGQYRVDKSINIKKYQLNIVEWLEEANIKKIVQVYHHEKKQLCIPCQGGLHNGELKCGNDLKRFIFVDMMRRTIGSMI